MTIEVPTPNTPATQSAVQGATERATVLTVQRTHLPQKLPEADAAPEVQRASRRTRREDVFRLAGAAAAGVAVTAWLFTQIAPFQGGLPFLVLSYGFFLVFYAVLVGLEDGVVGVVDRLATVVFNSVAVVLLIALIDIIVFTIARGSKALVHLNFWTQDLTLAGPLDPLKVGGMLHAAVGTLIMIAIALIISIPLGLLCAVFLAEFPGPFSRVVRTVVEAMTALPSIVCGLFIFATWILLLGMPKSGFAAALAITIMILPIIIRSADVVLRLVPGNLKEASLGLGASHWRTVMHVMLPTSRSGLMTAIILGTARGIGETSPVLLTAGYSSSFNFDPFTGPMTSLPLATFTLVKAPSDTQISRGFGAAAVLMVLVFVLFLLARLIGGKGAGELSEAGMRRARADSARMASRFTRRRLVPAGYGDSGFPPDGFRPDLGGTP
ncbi:MAG TPA: phosphate ABC transporter permease PstA [Gryllotalpicola sp.]